MEFRLILISKNKTVFTKIQKLLRHNLKIRKTISVLISVLVNGIYLNFSQM